jgi:hypothetical protein
MAAHDNNPDEPVSEIAAKLIAAIGAKEAGDPHQMGSLSLGI